MTVGRLAVLEGHDPQPGFPRDRLEMVSRESDAMKGSAPRDVLVAGRIDDLVRHIGLDEGGDDRKAGV